MITLSLFCADIADVEKGSIANFMGNSKGALVEAICEINGFASDEFPKPELGTIDLPHGAVHLLLSDGEGTVFDAFVLPGEATPEQIAEVQKKIDEA